MICLMKMDSEEEKGKVALLYEKYRRLLWRAAMDVLQDEYLAEDAVQDAFLKVGKNLDKIGEIESYETRCYLVVVARNAAIDIYRKRKIRMGWETWVEVEAADKIFGKDVQNFYQEEAFSTEMMEILKNLPDKYRGVLLLKYVNCLGNREIAEALGISEGAVRQRLSRGKRMIEKAIRGMGRKDGY